MTDKTTSGEPTFGGEKHKTVKVQGASGTDYVAYHDGETWYEGHYEESVTSGDQPARGKVQIAEAPVKLS